MRTTVRQTSHTSCPPSESFIQPTPKHQGAAYRVFVRHEYRIFRSDQSTARAEAQTLAARHFDLEPDEVLVVDALPIEEEDEPLGWLVSLLAETNASEG
jgi:hypothetical protein